MFEVLVAVIGALTVLVLLLWVRSRRSTGDPASSVQHFSRALSAMEPGSRPGDAPDDESAASEPPPGDEEPAAGTDEVERSER